MQTSMLCQQLIPQIFQWCTFGHFVQIECVKVPIIKGLKNKNAVDMKNETNELH